jgi:hypothetical protein
MYKVVRKMLRRKIKQDKGQRELMELGPILEYVVKENLLISW